MWRIRFIPDQTSLPFMQWRKALFMLSITLIVASAVLLGIRSLDFGIDFSGGIVIEVETETAADLPQIRTILGDLDLGDVALQEFGDESHALIRIERQDGGGQEQQAAITRVKEALEAYPETITYRRTESVGPKVGDELIQAGVIAIVVAIVLMLAYIWFRFELPFAIGAVIALVHDIGLTLGMLSLTGFEVNLASVAAILLIVGYSMNDTVVVYDRVRENLRKYKSMPLISLLNQSVNETLARTVVTSGTTLLALLALFIFGGEVIRGFSFTMIWGVIAGTYSSIFVAGALLLYVKPNRGGKTKSGDPYADAERLQANANLSTPIDNINDSSPFDNTSQNEDLSSKAVNNQTRPLKSGKTSSSKRRNRRNRRNRRKT
ncbi:MAG: protein translocase subunit SecF [Gammaproteobacteria bacterium]|jgi:preprotein translocase SecF subunit|nr:protein translocase subunit SecF [Gammaproteobacteria bacterium]